MKVALAHDMLAARAGGERVLSALATDFPDAEIHTLILDRDAMFDDFGDRPIHASRLSRSAWLRRNYRVALPIAAPLWRRRRIDADVTICSTSGLSHHARPTGRRIVYCHTPARWMHDPDAYLSGWSATTRLATTVLRPPMRRLDRTAMRSADLVLANSHRIAAEIETIYGVDARIVPPPSSLALDGPTVPLPVEPGFVLAVMRPLAYKRLDVLVDAARRRPDDRFVLIGDGPHRAQLLADAPANLASLGAVDDDRLRWAYRAARVAVVTCAEDFGLVPLEAAAHGLTTLVPDARGLLDHDDATVVRYPFASVDGLLDALDAAPNPTGVLDEARLGRARFRSAIREAIDDVT